MFRDGMYSSDGMLRIEYQSHRNGLFLCVFMVARSDLARAILEYSAEDTHIVTCRQSSRTVSAARRLAMPDPSNAAWWNVLIASSPRVYD